jgi:hypothetical protein
MCFIVLLEVICPLEYPKKFIEKVLDFPPALCSTITEFAKGRTLT